MSDISSEAQKTLARVKAAYDAEMAEARVAYSASEVPQSFEAITAEWLTDAICGQVADACIVFHEFGPADDGTTNRRSLTVSYNPAGQAAGLPDRLFCKASFGLPNRYALGPCGAIAAEVSFYNNVRPYLDIDATEGVFAVMNDAYNSIVMLKDISASVTEFCDHTTKVDRLRAESQVRLLAALHGKGASSPPLMAAQRQLQSWSDLFHGTKLFGLDAGARAGFDAAGDLIPGRTHKRASEVWAATERAVALNESRPHTIMHGDVHLKNWYVTAQGEMGLSDWQCTTHGHWGRDLAYTIGTALPVEQRRAWERDLIALYLDELGNHGGSTVDFDTAWTIYRQEMLPALAWWTVTFRPTPDMPDMQPGATATEFVLRLGTAIDDLESLDA